jgi:phage terminase small subunit
VSLGNFRFDCVTAQSTLVRTPECAQQQTIEAGRPGRPKGFLDNQTRRPLGLADCQEAAIRSRALPPVGGQPTLVGRRGNNSPTTRGNTAPRDHFQSGQRTANRIAEGPQFRPDAEVQTWERRKTRQLRNLSVVANARQLVLYCFCSTFSLGRHRYKTHSRQPFPFLNHPSTIDSMAPNMLPFPKLW